MLDATTPLLGYEADINSVTIREITGKAIVSLAVPHRGESKLKAAIKQAFKLALPKPGRFSIGGDAYLNWMAQDQYFLISGETALEPEKRVRAQIGETAYVTNQSDGFVIVSVSGGRALEALERICPIDLDPELFGIGNCARTTMEHLGVMIMRISESEYWLLSASSSAESFLHAITTSARNI